MSLVVVVLIASVLLGWVLGGRLERLGTVALRSSWLVVLAVLTQAGGALAVGRLGPASHALGLAVSAALAVAFVARNRHVVGTGLVALGIAANALVVGLNGAMPVSPQAAGRAGVGLGPVLGGEDLRHEVSGPGTRLAPLSDVIPFPLPLVPQVLSPGDVLVAAGLGQLVLLGMLGGARARPVGLGRLAARLDELGGTPARAGRDWKRGAAPAAPRTRPR